MQSRYSNVSVASGSFRILCSNEELALLFGVAWKDGGAEIEIPTSLG